MRLSILCACGILTIVVVVIRLPVNIANSTVQANRSILGSVEVLAAAIVVNALALYGAVNRLWKRKSPSTGAHSYPDGSLKPCSSGNTKHSNSSPYPMTIGSGDERPLCIHCHTTVRSESTHYLHCEDAEGILMTTIEASCHDVESLSKTLDTAPGERDSFDLSHNARK